MNRRASTVKTASKDENATLRVLPFPQVDGVFPWDEDLAPPLTTLPWESVLPKEPTSSGTLFRGAV